tara:strand:+ start:4621 stop:4899 length:279 start_codon:yes stop_codon:yes gene_type:complete
VGKDFHKNTTPFIKLLEALRIILVLDNYIIHKTEAVQRWLADNPQFELLFQPVYHPWVNQSDRLRRAHAQHRYTQSPMCLANRPVPERRPIP